MQAPTPSSLEELSKDELIQLLKAEQNKHGQTVQYVASMAHELRAPTSILLGYANLFSVEAENDPPLSELRITFIKGIKTAAEHIRAAVDSHLAYFRMLHLLEEPLYKTKISLAELSYFGQSANIPLKTDLTQIPPILADEEVVIAIMESLGYGKRDEAELVIREEGAYVRFIILNWAESYWVEKLIENETKRIVCHEQTRLFAPICIVAALVEKYDGEVYAELGSDSTYSLSFTLPVYKADPA